MPLDTLLFPKFLFETSDFMIIVFLSTFHFICLTVTHFCMHWKTMDFKFSQNSFMEYPERDQPTYINITQFRQERRIESGWLTLLNDSTYTSLYLSFSPSLSHFPTLFSANVVCQYRLPYINNNAWKLIKFVFIYLKMFYNLFSYKINSYHKLLT